MRVVICEDNVLLANGIQLILTSRGIDVVACVGNADDLLAASSKEQPDLAIVDVRLPPNFRDEGIRAAAAARSQQSDLSVLVLSQYVERTYATELLTDDRGGIGYLLKDRVGRVSEFLDAVHVIADGGTVMDREVVKQLLVRSTDDPLRRLTAREHEVLGLMAEGQDNTSIAQALFVTDNAVHKHIGSIFAKLELAPSDNVHRRVRAVLTYLNSRSDAPRIGPRPLSG
jgi:DNA-binding NarL/FixJ family response regulator